MKKNPISPISKGDFRDEEKQGCLINPKSIGVKYSLIVLGGGQDRPCLCFDLPIGQICWI